MADTASKHIDMTTGSLWRNIPLFAFPVAATSILEQLSNLIATVIIGNFSGDQGTLAMAAVGSNVPLTSLMLNLFIGMSLGSNVVIANAIGRDDQNIQTRRPYLDFNGARGFIVIALGEIFAEPMLAALNVPAETMPLASLYLRVFLLSMPSILLYNFEAAIFRSVGITRMPLQALAVSTVLNIGLDSSLSPYSTGVSRASPSPPPSPTPSAPPHSLSACSRPAPSSASPHATWLSTRSPQAHRQDRPASRHPKRRLCRSQHHHPVRHQQPGHRGHGGIERRYELGVRMLQPAQQL